MAASTTARRFVGLDTVALLELVRAGDHDAYGELFTRYQDVAYKVARGQSRRHADDYVAEAFRRVLTAISRGAGPTQGFGPYLAATIRSVAAGQAAPYQEVELDVSTVLDDEAADVDPRVATAYLSLPEAWQNALWYSDVEGMSPRHAAPLLDLPSANAFSALRKRARAGLRSAYLTQVVDEACNDDVRRHLEMLMAGSTTAEVVDDLVDEHLAGCDECAAIAWRVGAVTGSKVGVALAPAMIAFHGFTVSSALLPVGLGLTGLLGWFRRLPKQAAAAMSVGVVAGLVFAAVVAGSALRGGGTSDAADPVAPVGAAPSGSEVLAGPGAGGGADDGVDNGAGGSDAVSGAVPPESTTTSTTSTSTTTSAPTTTTATTATTATSVPVRRAPTTTTATVPRVHVPAATTTTTTPATTTTTTTTTATTTTTPATTTTTPATTTTVSPTTTTTMVAPTTTTTTTTTLPVIPPGSASIASDAPIGNSGKKRVELVVSGLTGEPGTITVSAPFSVRNVTNLTCDASSCSLGGVSAPATASVEFEVDLGPVTFSLLDSSGAVVQTLTSP